MNRKRKGIIIGVVVAAVIIFAFIVAIVVINVNTTFQMGISSVIGPAGIIIAAAIGGITGVSSKKKSAGKSKNAKGQGDAESKENKKSKEGMKSRQEEEIRDKEKLDIIIREIKERTKTDFYKIRLEEGPTDIYSSKLGGVPYWDPELEYPTDPNEHALILLAQINFEKEKFDDERLPQKGMLQFFIANDDCYGCDYGSERFYDDKQEKWRAVYHEVIKEGLTEEDIMKLDILTHKTTTVESPMDREMEPVALRFEKREGCMSTGDYRFEGLYESILKEKFGEEMDERHWYNPLNNAEFDYITKAIDTWGHKMLGYPNFAQWDPRREGVPYDMLLLEIESEKVGSKWIMWGDMGVANFFINSESLKNKDFSRIAYTWDCG